MFSGEGEDAKSFSMKMRFLAIEVTTEKEAHDEFELTVKSSEQDRSDMCLNALDALTLVDPMSGIRDYKVTEDGTEDWQFFYIESRVDGIDNVGDCQHQLTMAIDYQKPSGTWVELWNEKKSMEYPDKNLRVEMNSTYTKLYVNMNQTDFEKHVQFEFNS
jgi:hypothetical protein